MMTEYDIIDSVRRLINVASVNALVKAIRPVESLPEDTADKTKFITIGLLAGTADQMQTGFVNINIYCPELAGVPDYASLRTITNAVIPLVEEACVNDISFELNAVPKTMREQDIDGYYFTNVLLKFYNPNIH